MTMRSLGMLRPDSRFGVSGVTQADFVQIVVEDGRQRRWLWAVRREYENMMGPYPSNDQTGEQQEPTSQRTVDAPDQAEGGRDTEFSGQTSPHHTASVCRPSIDKHKLCCKSRASVSPFA
jgi:hypothetical protein